MHWVYGTLRNVYIWVYGTLRNVYIWVYGSLYMPGYGYMGPCTCLGTGIWVPGHGIYHGLGPGNTHGNTPVLPPHYPGYTHPTRAVHRGAGYLAEHALLNANAFLSKWSLVGIRFTIPTSVLYRPQCYTDLRETSSLTDLLGK